VKRVLRPSNAKRLYTDEKSTEIGEIKEQKNRKVKVRKKECKEKEEPVLPLCLTSTLQPV